MARARRQPKRILNCIPSPKQPTTGRSTPPKTPGSSPRRLEFRRGRTCARPGGGSRIRARPGRAWAGGPPTECCAGTSSKQTGSPRTSCSRRDSSGWRPRRPTSSTRVRRRSSKQRERASRRPSTSPASSAPSATPCSRSRPERLFQGNAKTFYALAAQLKISMYFNLGDELDDWRVWLATKGPILTRLNVDSTWDRATTTKGKLEVYRPQTAHGGHCVDPRRLHAGDVHRPEQLGDRVGRSRLRARVARLCAGRVHRGVRDRVVAPTTTHQGEET